MVSSGTSQVAGKVFYLTVTAEDARGNVVTGYAGTVHFSSSDSGSGVSLPSDYTFQPNDKGIMCFSATLVTPTENGSITATDTANNSITGSQTGITVTAASASRLVFVDVPSSLDANVASGAITVQLQDDHGYLAKAESDVIIVLSPSGKWYSDSNCSIPILNDQVTISAGSISSSHFYFKSASAGSVLLGASGGNYVPASASLMVNAALDHIVVSPCSASIAAGASQVYSAEAFDQYGKSLGSVPAVFSAVGASVVGNSVSASVVGYYMVTGAYMGKSAVASLTVTPAVVVSAVAISSVGSSVVAGLSKVYSATASDVFGNTWDVTSLTSWSVSSGAGGSWSGNVYTSAKAGSWTVTGTYASTAYTAGLTVTPSAVAYLVVSSGASQVAGKVFYLTVTAKDAHGNVVTDYAGTVHFSSSDSGSGVSLPSDYTFQSNDKGVKSFLVMLVTATSAGSVTATDVVNGSIAGSQTGITVTAASGSRLVFVDVPSSLDANVASGAITVQLQDAFGNCVVNTGPGIAVTLSPSGVWYSDSDGSVPIGQVTISSGSISSSHFYFKSNAAGNKST